MPSRAHPGAAARSFPPQGRGDRDGHQDRRVGCHRRDGHHHGPVVVERRGLGQLRRARDGERRATRQAGHEPKGRQGERRGLAPAVGSTAHIARRRAPSAGHPCDEERPAPPRPHPVRPGPEEGVEHRVEQLPRDVGAPREQGRAPRCSRGSRGTSCRPSPPTGPRRPLTTRWRAFAPRAARARAPRPDRCPVGRSPWPSVRSTGLQRGSGRGRILARALDHFRSAGSHRAAPDAPIVALRRRSCRLPRPWRLPAAQAGGGAPAHGTSAAIVGPGRPAVGPARAASAPPGSGCCAAGRPGPLTHLRTRPSELMRWMPAPAAWRVPGRFSGGT